jgi:tetraacyldisaccharide 4'-kinase
MFQFIKYIFLWPFSFIYWLILQLRYFSYYSGLKQVYKFKTPIISIGNLTVGGTGKTPIVHFIAEELNEQYHQIAIISRGYGRKSKGFQLVHDGKKILLNPEVSGDEPYLLANLLGNCIVAVDENRINAIHITEQKFNPDIIILDDGFQQLGVQKDLDILLLNSSKPFSELSLLPIGYGRETKKQIQRSSLIVLTKTIEFKLPNWVNKLKYNNVIYSSKFDYEIWEYSKSKYKKIEKFHDGVFAFCGIGDPNSFEVGLKTLGINPVKFKSLKDHEPYSKNTIKALIVEIKQAKVDYIITTEKDIVKLPDGFLKKYRIFTLRVRHNIGDKDSFMEQIKSKLERKNR